MCLCGLCLCLCRWWTVTGLTIIRLQVWTMKLFGGSFDQANGKQGSRLYRVFITIRVQNADEKARIHLRMDADGHGTLIVNANRILHLNPSAAFMAWLILEEKTKEESRPRHNKNVMRSASRQAEEDLSAFNSNFLSSSVLMVHVPSTNSNWKPACLLASVLLLLIGWTWRSHTGATMTVRIATTPAPAISPNWIPPSGK